MKNDAKMEAKRAPKTTSKSTFGRAGVAFSRFWGAFGGVRFSMNFRSAKSEPKNRKNATWGCKMTNSRSKWVGSAGRAGSVRGFWSLQKSELEYEFWFDTPSAPRETGPADLKGSALPADPYVWGVMSVNSDGKINEKSKQIVQNL